MRMKKQIILIEFLFLIFLISGFVSAVSCVITETTSCSSNAVMGLSNLTNAHGELVKEGNYNYVLCCDFRGGSTMCLLKEGGSETFVNKIIGLSSETNAHAEIPSLTNYNYDVCYEQLECAKRTDTCNPGEMGVLSLSSDTNAHIGGFEDYDVKICCTGMCEEGEEYIDGECVIEQVAYWANKNGNYITEANVVLETTSVLMILKNSGLPQGTQVDFKIYEEDLVFDDLIRTISGTIDANGNAEESWTVTQEDIDSTGEPESFDNFYFIANSETSNELNITIKELPSVNWCSDYDITEDCNDDICEVAKESVENIYEIECGKVWTEEDCTYEFKCMCNWDDNECEAVWELKVDCDGEPFEPLIGTCSYNSDTTDDCDDGYLEYSWTATWTWGENNNFTGNPNGGAYVENPLGTWHYDPDKIYLDCVNGSRTIQCPAQIKLPVFTLYNAIIALAVIGLIYVIWNYKKKRK